MDCPECGYIMVEDPDVDLATCPECGHVVELDGGPELPTPTGSLNMIPIGGVFKTAWGVYRKNMHLFLAAWAIPTLLVFVMQFFYMFGSMSLPEASELTQEQLYSLQPVFFLNTMFPTILYIFFSVIIIRMATDVFLHGKTDLGSGFKTLGYRIPVLLGASVFFALAIQGWSLGGSILCYIPSMVCCYWWMFSLIIIVMEGASLSEAFAVSKEFAKSRSSFSFTLSIILIIFSLSLAGAYLAQFFGTYFSSTNSALLANISLTILQWVLYPLLIIAIVAFYMTGRKVLKEELAKAEEEGDEDEDSDEDESDDDDGDEDPDDEDDDSDDDADEDSDDDGEETAKEDGDDVDDDEEDDSEDEDDSDEEDDSEDDEPIAPTPTKISS